jgi:hypothetical protein
MTNKPKATGTRAESAVTTYLTAEGIDAARTALHGSKDQGDVFIRLGKYLVTVEVKSYKSWASARQIEKWLDDADLECLNADADASILIVKRPGSGAANAGDWLCYMRADEWEWLAYGSPIGTPARREWVSVPLSHMVIVLRGVL